VHSPSLSPIPGDHGRQLSQALILLVTVVCIGTAGFCVIEIDVEAFQNVCERGYLAVNGSATDDATLEQAGIRRAAHMVSVVSNQSENIVIALSARQLQPDLVVIARAENEEAMRKLRMAGASRIVSPYKAGGNEIADVVTRPKVADFLARSTLESGDIGLAAVRIGEGSALVGRTLEHYGQNETEHVAFVAIEREGMATQIPPRGDTTLVVGDHLIVAGNPDEITAMQVAARSSGRRGAA